VASTGCAATRATAPWRRAGDPLYADPRKRALSFAILAPNPHNRQPWLVSLDTPEEIVLYCDPDRLLRETDPFDRQILIGLGAFLEILRMAAAQEGIHAQIETFPEGVPAVNLDARPIARIRFSQAEIIFPDPLFAQILDRRSLKEPYDTTRPVSSGVLSSIGEAVSPGVSVAFTNAEPKVARLRDLSMRAHLVETTTDRTNMESVRLMRIGQQEIEANPDGIALGGMAMGLGAFLGIVTRDKLADEDSMAFKEGLEMYDRMLHTAMAYLWISTNDNSRQKQLDAGAAWVRANLKATALGVGIHPLSQSLQEYPEMKDLYQEIHGLLAADGTRIQMFARLGYGPKTDPSPRWPIESRILQR